MSSLRDEKRLLSVSDCFSFSPLTHVYLDECLSTYTHIRKHRDACVHAGIADVCVHNTDTYMYRLMWVLIRLRNVTIVG
jgi:hypothetical protein